MSKIASITAVDDWILVVEFSTGAQRKYDVKPLLKCEAFRPLSDIEEFRKVRNAGYYIEWECGADLSADTIYIEGE